MASNLSLVGEPVSPSLLPQRAATLRPGSSASSWREMLLPAASGFVQVPKRKRRQYQVAVRPTRLVKTTTGGSR